VLDSCACVNVLAPSRLEQQRYAKPVPVLPSYLFSLVFPSFGSVVDPAPRALP